jgi:hypothetical protein
MNVYLHSAFVACALALAACAPRAEAPVVAERSASDPIIPSNPFFGKWQLTRAQVAPWWDKKGETPLADPALTMLTFEPSKSSGAPIVACDKPKYSVSLATPPGLFQGNLAEPFSEARMLGFMDKEITVLNFGCESGGADVSLDFPMLNEDTIMLGLDNMIYTLSRTPG